MLTLTQIDTALDNGDGYVAIMTTGQTAIMKGRPTIDLACKAIGCETIDVLVLNRGDDGQPKIVMLVDDEGLLNDSPVNPEATKLAWSALGPGFQHSIHGNVVIANDHDFGRGI